MVRPSPFTAMASKLVLAPWLAGWSARWAPIAVEIIRKYLRKTDVEDSYEYAAKYLERVPKVDPASIQTVLAWENKSDIAPSRFYDNTIIDRLVQEGFFDGLYK